MKGKTHLIQIHLHLNQTNLILQEPNRRAHTDAERSRADEVRDLRVEVRGGEVAGEGRLGRWGVGGDDLREERGLGRATERRV